jgi:hypothetical protein
MRHGTAACPHPPAATASPCFCQRPTHGLIGDGVAPPEGDEMIRHSRHRPPGRSRGRGTIRQGDEASVLRAIPLALPTGTGALGQGHVEPRLDEACAHPLDRRRGRCGGPVQGAPLRVQDRPGAKSGHESVAGPHPGPLGQGQPWRPLVVRQGHERLLGHGSLLLVSQDLGEEPTHHNFGGAPLAAGPPFGRPLGMSGHLLQYLSGHCNASHLDP